MKLKIAFLGSFFCSYLYGETITLHKAYTEALKNNHNLKSSYQKERISDKRQEEALSTLLPSIHAIVTRNRYINTTTTNTSYKNSPSNYDSQSYELKLTQPLFNSVAFTEYTKSQISSQMGKLEYYSYMQELLLEVVGAYTELLSGKEKYQESQAKVATLKEQLATVQKKFDLGDATIQDLTDTNSKYFMAKSQELETQLNVDIASAKLQKITGIATLKDTEFSPIMLFHEAEIETEIENIIQEAFTNNLTLQIKKLSVEYSLKDLKSKKGEYYPKLDLIGSISYNEVEKGVNSIEDYHTRQNYLGVQLIAPLYEGGSTTAKVDIAKEENIQILEELESYKQELRFNIIKEYQGLKTIQSQIKSFNTALESANMTLDAAKVGYALGTRTQYEVLQSIEQIYTIKNALLDAKHRYKLGQLRLKYLLGTLNSEDLKE